MRSCLRFWIAYDDMGALKRVTPRRLRQGVAQGRRVLLDPEI